MGLPDFTTWEEGKVKMGDGEGYIGPVNRERGQRENVDGLTQWGRDLILFLSTHMDGTTQVEIHFLFLWGESGGEPKTNGRNACRCSRQPEHHPDGLGSSVTHR